MAPEVLARLSRLEHVLGVLRELRGRAGSYQSYRDDEALRDRVERNFQVAVEALIDVANHLSARRGLRVAPDSGGAFD